MSRRLLGQKAGPVFMREAAVNCQYDSPLAPDGVESITLYSFHLARRGLYYTTFSPNKYQHVRVVSVFGQVKEVWRQFYVFCYFTLLPYSVVCSSPRKDKDAV
jgi:hypothetical protein